jgi:hypothetical protein
MMVTCGIFGSRYHRISDCLTVCLRDVDIRHGMRLSCLLLRRMIRGSWQSVTGTILYLSVHRIYRCG